MGSVHYATCSLITGYSRALHLCAIANFQHQDTQDTDKGDSNSRMCGGLCGSIVSSLKCCNLLSTDDCSMRLQASQPREVAAQQYALSSSLSAQARSHRHQTSTASGATRYRNQLAVSAAASQRTLKSSSTGRFLLVCAGNHVSKPAFDRTGAASQQWGHSTGYTFTAVTVYL